METLEKQKIRTCTKHMFQRWTERIVGIKDEKERDRYIAENRQQIEEHANKSFEFAEFIHRGQLGDNVTRNYYIKDKMVFVLNATDDAFVTIYEVDMGFDDDLNLLVAKNLQEKLKRLQEENESFLSQEKEEMDNLVFKMSALDDEIKIVEAQLKNLKERREFLKQESQQISKKSKNTRLEIEKVVTQLINSKEYKNDLLAMK